MTQNDQDHIAGRLASSIEALKETLEKVVTDMEIVEAWADALPRDEKEKEIQKQVKGWPN